MSALPAIATLGDSALLLQFGETIAAAVNQRVHAAARCIAAANLSGITDLVPAYASLGVHYDWMQWCDENGANAGARCAAALLAALAQESAAPGAALAPIVIPVCYAAEYAPDLAALATQARLSPDEVVTLHCGADYQVAMLGFAPGFPYLLGLDPRLHCPRQASPRTRVAAGSVAIGGAQTGIYPRALPGGWNLIGRTPSQLFDLERSPANLLSPGQSVRFREIDHSEFIALSASNRNND